MKDEAAIEIGRDWCLPIGGIASFTYLKMRIKGTGQWSRAIILWFTHRFYKEIWF